MGPADTVEQPVANIDLDISSLENQVRALKWSLIVILSIIVSALITCCARKYAVFDRIAALIPPMSCGQGEQAADASMVNVEQTGMIQSSAVEETPLSDEEIILSVPHPILPSAPVEILASESVPALESGNEQPRIG